VGLKYAAVDGTLSIFNPNIANEDEHWVVSYQPTFCHADRGTGKRSSS
jgi:hypothetical protein